MTQARAAIEELVARETRAWDTRDVELLLSVFHQDMVWPWPPTAQAHDPAEWVLKWGRYDRERWRRGWQALFDSHELVHNRRLVRRIEASTEEDGGFAVVDVDTLWRNREDGSRQHWQGRACKIYTRLLTGEWRMTAQTGLLQYESHTAMGPPTPELPVADVERAQQHYRDALGFEIGWLYPGKEIGAVSRDNAAIFFRRRVPPFEPAVHWMFTREIDATYERLRSSGARIVEPLEMKPWGMRQFTVEDVDGNRFYFHA